jgi:2-polyprenyl-3-methyl-5-hydroxy-6-metoxy-1,4-benzoquinol methylase
MNHNKNCLVCESTNIQPLKGYYDEKGLVKCKACKFVFMERIPTESELQDYYTRYSYTAEQKLPPSTITSYGLLLDEFEAHRKTNKLLDVGCGRGFFLDEAKKRGWEVYGSEYADEAIELCKSKGLKMHQGKLKKDAFNQSDFDVITSFEVIEHINNPNEEVSIIQSLLRAGGLFYCTTPNFDSAMRLYLKSDYNVICYPEHLSYYTKSTLTKVCEQNGLKQSKFLSTGISISRLKNSKKDKKPETQRGASEDEVLRESISKKKHLQIAKKLVNSALTNTNTGISLKGYFIKK